MNDFADARNDDAPIGPVERYSNRWRLGFQSESQLNSFLDSESLSPLDVVNVLRTDMKFRWHHGDPILVEEYVRRLPGELPDPEAVLDLIYTEYLVREEIKDSPDANDYCVRFPAVANSFRVQLALHDAMNVQEVDDGSDLNSFANSVRSNFGPLPRVFGRYRLLTLLGRGGMGAVYLAFDSQLDRQVAIKIPTIMDAANPLMGARFKREAQTAAVLNYPQLCPVFDVGQIEGIDYLTMPFIPGGALSHAIKNRPMFAAEEAVRLVIQAARALEVAHKAGIVHRDLKPSNILLTASGEPVITDFGLAIRTASMDPVLTEAGVPLWTATYMPPEQIHYDAGAVGPRSDIYSLGAILYELLVGRPPFQGSRLEIIRKTLAELPIPPSKARKNLDPRFDEICLRALAKTPKERFSSMTEFADRLSHVLEPPRQATLRLSAKRIALGLLGVLVVAVGITFWPKLYSDKQSISRETQTLDPFRVGSLWSGRYAFQPPHTESGVASLKITERSGATFRAEYATKDPFSWMVEGTAESGLIHWDLLTPLTEEAGRAVPPHGAVVNGEYSETEITAVYVDRGDASRSQLTLRRKGRDETNSPSDVTAN